MTQALFGNGIGDDTAAIQELIDEGGEVHLPAGIYKVSRLRMRESVHLIGSGALCTTLKTTDPASDVIRIENQGVQIRNLGFSSYPVRTGGCYVNFTEQAQYGLIDNFFMEGAYLGLRIAGPVALYAEHGAFNGTRHCAVLIDGGQDHYLRNLTANNEPDQQPDAGIRIRSTGNTNISDCDIIHCGNDLEIEGGFAIYVRDSFFDTARNGIVISAKTPVERCHFHGCWTSSHEGHGVLIDPNGNGIVDTIDFIGHHALLNGADGLHLGRGKNLKVIGSSCSENNLSGIAVGAAHVVVQGNRLGETTTLKGNRFGCYLLPSATSVMVVGNDMEGNEVAGLIGIPTLAANNLGVA